MYFLSSVKNSLKEGQRLVTINTNQCPLSWQQPRRKAFSRKRVSSSQTKAEDVCNDDDDGLSTSHCHRKKRKTSRVMMMDGLSTEAEERSRLQRLSWHEQIDTTAPPPKCRVLGQGQNYSLLEQTFDILIK